MKISEHCPAVSGFKEKLSWEVNTYKKFIAPQRVENNSGWGVIKDMTGVGAIYSMGTDWSHMKRAMTAFKWLKSSGSQVNKELNQLNNPKILRSVNDLRQMAKKTFDGVGSDALRGMASKAWYLGSLTLGVLGLCLESTPIAFIGALGMVGATGYFVMNAVYRADEAKSVQNTTDLLDKMLNNLGDQLNQEIASEPKADGENVQKTSEPATAPAA